MIFLEFLDFYLTFFPEIFHADAKWQYLKCDVLIFEKHVFSAENFGNIPENRFFGNFSRFYHYDFFLTFYTTICISNAQNMTQSDFWGKFFSCLKMEICRKSPFFQIFIGLNCVISLFFGPTWRRSYKLAFVRPFDCYQLFSGLAH